MWNLSYKKKIDSLRHQNFLNINNINTMTTFVCSETTGGLYFTTSIQVQCGVVSKNNIKTISILVVDSYTVSGQ